MAIKNKLLTVLAVFIVLLLLAGAGACKADTAKGGIKDKSDVKTLGGIESAMPENSAMVFFGSTLGKTLLGYNAYKNTDELLFALKSGEVDAIWTCDVTADYLMAKDPGLKKLPVSEMSDIQNTKENRFEFGMALKDTDAGKKLKEEIDRVLGDMKDDGTLDFLTTLYISIPRYDKMENKDQRLYPAFTSLMKGRVDLIFAYGTGEITTESKKKFITTVGYYPMKNYEFLTYGK